MKLIVGIGNPGKEYEHTRHNIGFDALDLYAKKNNLLQTKEKFNGLYYETIIDGEKVILLKPQSYVNLSGIVVRKYVDYFKIEIDDILVIVDDLDQAIGQYKIKANSGSGGHNGLKNIEEHLNTKKYKRLKIGIANNKSMDTKDYVLGRFSKEERDVINHNLEISTDVIDDFVKLDFNQLMTKYNTKI